MTLELLRWGLQMGVVVSGLVGLVLLLRRPFAKYLGAEATFLLWAVVFLRHFVPEIRLPVKSDIDLLQFDRLAFYEPLDAAPAPAEVDPIIVAPPPPTAIPIFTWEEFWAGLALLWLSIAVIWLTYTLIRHIKYKRLLQHVSTPAAAAMNPLIEQSMALTKLKRRPQILIAPKNIGPLVSGVLSPIVILPKDFDIQYDDTAQLIAMSHEFSHIKRRDTWWSLAMLILRAVHWYNPLVHYAAGKFRLDLEAACDARTLACFGDADIATRNYAMTLLQADQKYTSQHMPALSLALHPTPTLTSKGKLHDSH